MPSPRAWCSKLVEATATVDLVPAKCSCCHVNVPWVKGLCSRCYHKNWRATHKAARRRGVRNRGADRREARNSNLRRNGGTPAFYDWLLLKQNGCCAICGINPLFDRSRGVLHFDHDHKTGAARGLLCARCNLALGQFDDSRYLLATAAGYLMLAESLPQPQFADFEKNYARGAGCNKSSITEDDVRAIRANTAGLTQRLSLIHI